MSPADSPQSLPEPLSEPFSDPDPAVRPNLAATTPLYLRPSRLAMVATGGALGALARWLLTAVTAEWSSGYSILAANLIGSLCLGFLSTWLALSGRRWTGELSMVWCTGFLGAFTTYSTFAVDVHRFATTSVSTAIAWGALTICGCLLLSGIGYALATYTFVRRERRRRAHNPHLLGGHNEQGGAHA